MMKTISEKFVGIVKRVTYHNTENGWSVLRVTSFSSHGEEETVTVHQTKVFAGATMEFHGNWSHHPKFGRQFKAHSAIEKKPASAAALEKYLGSGLIKGVGPKTAKKIVAHFNQQTLEVFEKRIDRLTEVPGIAKKKLKSIEQAWKEHQGIREVMIFLQSHGISTLFAVRIYKKYGDKAIGQVSTNPYRLAADFYGIGFLSADKVALSIGFGRDSNERLVAAIQHVLAGAREQGHCYLTESQIDKEVHALLGLDLEGRLQAILFEMQQQDHLKVRQLPDTDEIITSCYYSKSLFYDEQYIARSILEKQRQVVSLEGEKIRSWLGKFCQNKEILLSEEQRTAVEGVIKYSFSVLTGGPGCGKTTTTEVIVKLLEAMGKFVLLAAPTGRAAQRMGEVIGREAKTLHRLLEWQLGFFKRNEENPLKADFLIVDECSMLDIHLAASLLRAVPSSCQLLFIGDSDQLPSVGAGNVLNDIISSKVVSCFRLHKVFRQAQNSDIIKFAHKVNKGETPRIESPFKTPGIWSGKTDCMFIDSEQATKEQTSFVVRVKKGLRYQLEELETLSPGDDPYIFRTNEPILSSHEQELIIPKKFTHVDIEHVLNASNEVEELRSVLKTVHPWSSLHYGLTALDVVTKLYGEWVPKYFGAKTEIQVLSPMTRGSLGTVNLNKMLQQSINPPTSVKAELLLGDRIYRYGDRVIHRRNNYDLEVFNGDIGVITGVDNENMALLVSFMPAGRVVEYQRDDIVELDLAYAITIHKSQGSEFPVVIIPILNQHFAMLYRNLIYTGLTRGKKLVIFVGARKAMAMAVKNRDTSLRQSGLQDLLKGLDG